MSAPAEKPPIIWLNTLVFAITFIIAVIGVPWYGMMYGFAAELWWALVLTIGFAGISITAGYHRLWSHRAYDANPVLRFCFAIGGALAIQNSVLHWASDHREHHKHVDDNDHDPYSAGRGFWYSHIGWMLREYQQHRYTNYENVKDLQQDKIVMWQHRHYLTLTLLTSIGWPLLVGFLVDDIWGALLLVGFMRVVLNHHTTFFINSLAHMWGKQTYTDRSSARDNGWLALLTFGEGYHNYHHIFSADYRNGIKWYHFDPTKWLIRACSFIGWTKNLKRTNGYQIEKARLTMQMQRVLGAAQPEQLPHRAQAAWQQLQQEYDTLLAQVKTYYQTRKALLDARTQQLKAKMHMPDLHMPSVAEMQQQLADIRARVQVQKRQWQQQLAHYQQLLAQPSAA